jgi:hypothetical protein
MLFFLGADSHSASQEINFSQETGSCHHHIRKGPQRVPILSENSKSHHITAFLVPTLLLLRLQNDILRVFRRFCIPVFPVRATRHTSSPSLNTLVSPLERLTVTRVVKKFLAL